MMWWHTICIACLLAFTTGVRGEGGGKLPPVVTPKSPGVEATASTLHGFLEGNKGPNTNQVNRNLRENITWPGLPNMPGSEVKTTTTIKRMLSTATASTTTSTTTARTTTSTTIMLTTASSTKPLPEITATTTNTTSSPTMTSTTVASPTMSPTMMPATAASRLNNASIPDKITSHRQPIKTATTTQMLGTSAQRSSVTSTDSGASSATSITLVSVTSPAYESVSVNSTSPEAENQTETVILVGAALAALVGLGLVIVFTFWISKRYKLIISKEAMQKEVQHNIVNTAAMLCDGREMRKFETRPNDSYPVDMAECDATYSVIATKSVLSATSNESMCSLPRRLSVGSQQAHNQQTPPATEALYEVDSLSSRDNFMGGLEPSPYLFPLPLAESVQEELESNNLELERVVLRERSSCHTDAAFSLSHSQSDTDDLEPSSSPTYAQPQKEFGCLSRTNSQPEGLNVTCNQSKSISMDSGVMTSNSCVPSTPISSVHSEEGTVAVSRKPVPLKGCCSDAQISTNGKLPKGAPIPKPQASSAKSRAGTASDNMYALPKRIIIHCSSDISETEVKNFTSEKTQRSSVDSGIPACSPEPGIVVYTQPATSQTSHSPRVEQESFGGYLVPADLVKFGEAQASQSLPISDWELTLAPQNSDSISSSYDNSKLWGAHKRAATCGQQKRSSSSANRHGNQC